MPSPAADGNKYRELHPGITQRVRDLGTLNPEWLISIQSLPSEIRGPCRKGRKNERAREDEERKVRLCKSTRAKTAACTSRNQVPGIMLRLPV